MKLSMKPSPLKGYKYYYLTIAVGDGSENGLEITNRGISEELILVSFRLSYAICMRRKEWLHKKTKLDRLNSSK